MKLNLICTLLLFLNYVSAQEAETLFKQKYSKFSYFIGYSKTLQNNKPNIQGNNYPSFQFNNTTDWQAGFYFNAYQTGDFNFKTGILVRSFRPNFDLNVTTEDIGFNIDYTLVQFDAFDQIIISIPVKTEYFIPINKDFNLTFGLGFNVNYFPKSDVADVFAISVVGPNTEKVIAIGNNVLQKDANISTDISFGINYKTKYALLDFSFLYEKNIMSNLLTGNYRIFNLVQSPNTSGDYIVNNNFIGVGLTITPKKLKKQKQKT